MTDVKPAGREAAPSGSGVLPLVASAMPSIPGRVRFLRGLGLVQYHPDNVPTKIVH